MNEEITASKAFQILESFNKEKNKKFVKKANSIYLIKSYKIKSLSQQQAIDQYSRLFCRYHNEELKFIPNDWHKNERRLFLWYLICLSEHTKIQIAQITQISWNQMSKLFFGKNPAFLKFQGLTIFKNIKKHAWSQDHDKVLESCVKQMGNNSWNEISKVIFLQKSEGLFISSKQCRQRWFNHINKDLNKKPWTNQEDLEMLKMCLQSGTKWSQIARSMSTNRTEHMVKNRYVSILHKLKLNARQQPEQIVKRAICNIENQTTQKSQYFKINTEQDLVEQPDEKIEVRGKTFSQKQAGCSMSGSLVALAEQESSERDYQQSESKIKFLMKKIIQQVPVQVEDLNFGLGVDPSPFSITPSSIRPSSFSPFAFLTGFDIYASEFEKKRQDFQLSPFPLSLSGTMTESSPFNFTESQSFKRSSFYSPVGISDLSMELSQIINRNDPPKQD